MGPVASRGTAVALLLVLAASLASIDLDPGTTLNARVNLDGAPTSPPTVPALAAPSTLRQPCQTANATAFGPGIVWQSKPESGPVVRIPVLAQSPNGTLLAFAEYRHNGPADFGHTDIVLRRSHNGGLSWSAQDIVTSNGNDSATNPLVAVDAGTGRITLLSTWNSANATGPRLRDGETLAGTRTVWQQWSTDDGRTWSNPIEITDVVKRPNWSHYGTGPGHAKQFAHGPYAGRLVAAAWHSDPAKFGSPTAYGAHVLLSDDGGISWRIGANAGGDGNVNPTEGSLAIVDSRVLMVVRDEQGYAPGNLAQAWSSDGGESFDAPFVAAPRLFGPAVHGAMASCTDGEGTYVIHAGPRNPTLRRDLCLQLMETGGWRNGASIHPGPAAYSDLINLGDGTLGLLFEAGDSWKYDGIRFQRIPWATALEDQMCETTRPAP